MNKKQRKEKSKRQRDIQKLKRKYIKKSKFTTFVLCRECKFRNDCNFCNKNTDYCSNGVIDLNLIRESIKKGK